MPLYRVNLLDALGSFRSRGDHDCANDAAAHDLAATLLPQNGHAEIWSGTRRVGSVRAGRPLDEAPYRSLTDRTL